MTIRISAEWEPHACCWMAWVVHPEWGKVVNKVKRELSEVIQTIARCEPVRVLAPRAQSFREARRELAASPLPEAFFLCSKAFNDYGGPIRRRQINWVISPQRDHSSCTRVQPASKTYAGYRPGDVSEGGVAATSDQSCLIWHFLR